MDLERARYLVSPEARRALPALDGERSEEHRATLNATDPVALATALRREFAPAPAAALAEQLTLRARARRLGKRADLLLHSDGLEMMTHPVVAARRARRLAELDLPIRDLTAGLGGDSRAALDAGLSVVALERDPATALLAHHNLPGARVVTGDATAPPFALDGAALLLDPSRRRERRRTFDPASFSPPWEAVLALGRSAATAVIKAPPGISGVAIPADAEVEYVQFGRSMREATIWLGALAQPARRSAVLLPGEHVLDGAQTQPPPVATTVAGDVLYDPAPAVTLAGLLPELAASLGASVLDPRVGYLVAPRYTPTPFASAFEVLAVERFALKPLRRRLRDAHLRPAEVRRRAFPVEPDEFRRLLGPLEGDPVTLFLTTAGRERLAIVASPLDRATLEKAGPR